METVLPVVPVATLILGAYLIPLSRRLAPGLVAHVAVVCTVVAALTGVRLLWLTAGGEVARYHAGGWGPPFGIEVRVGFAEAFVFATIATVALLVVIWSRSGLAGEIHAQAVPWFYTMLLLTVAGMLGMSMAADMFNMYVFIELTGIGACALVAAKSDRRGTLASFEYLALATVGSGFILLAIGLIYMVTGHLNLAHAAGELALVWGSYPNLLWVASALFLIGFGVKGALFPLHVWLPNAHVSAPSPASAVLSGLVVKVYAFSLLKIMTMLLVGLDPAPTWAVFRSMILLLAIAAVIGGSVFALVQSHIKRLLAYSTVAQIGYIFVGFSIGSAAGVAAAMFHMLAHALMKSCMFLAAGSIAQRTGATRIADYDGMGRRMPLTMAAFSVGALSMIGIPGLAGLVSKWQLASSAVLAGMPSVAVLMVVSGLLNAGYYLPILERAYFRPPRGQHLEGTAPVSMTAVLLMLAAACVVLGVLPGGILDLLRDSLSTGF